MFGHTFLRIDSEYDSKLLSYAVNYAANANTDTENGFIFAIKGLIGGYYGQYSLLPYYDKLKEYRDSEQRDIWEYDLDLTEAEVQRMFRHIWELNGTHSYYYFFTENCSYNILWFIEAARPSLHIREKFNFQVIPISTVHATNEFGIIKEKTHFRPSRRTTILTYEKLLNKRYIDLTMDLSDDKYDVKNVLEDTSIIKEQKVYIIETAIELVEYKYSKSDISKKQFLPRFHKLTKARASLGTQEKINIKRASDPLQGHKDLRTSVSLGVRDNKFIQMIGIRPAYHDIKDSDYGFLRGTQIEFMDFLLSHSDGDVEIEKATLLSIQSLAQRTEFFKPYSWRLKFGFDRNSLDDNTNFTGTVGGGFSWGNKDAYFYLLVDPFFYMDSELTSGIGGSIGVVYDKYDFAKTNLEATHKFYETGDEQLIVEFTQSFRLEQNLQLQLSYEYKQRELRDENYEQTTKATLNFYF